MRTALATIAAAAGVITVACVGRSPVSSNSPSSPAVPTRCDASKAQFAIAQTASADLLERARIAAGARAARFIRPGEAITMEYSGSRLNLALNDRDNVIGATCG